MSRRVTLPEVRGIAEKRQFLMAEAAITGNGEWTNDVISSSYIVDIGDRVAQINSFFYKTASDKGNFRLLHRYYTVNIYLI